MKKAVTWGFSAVLGLIVLALLVVAGTATAEASPLSGKGGQGAAHAKAGKPDKPGKPGEKADKDNGERGPGPGVVWAGRPVSITLAPGQSVDYTASFTVSRVMTNVQISVLKAKGSTVALAAPTSFARVEPGQTYQVRLRLTAPTDSKRSSYNSQVRAYLGRKAAGPPLNIHVRVKRQ